MSEVRIESRKFMHDFYNGAQPQLGSELAPLQETEVFEQISVLAQLSKYLPQKARSRLAYLAGNALYSKENGKAAITEEAASGFLALEFGTPDREILDRATPVFLSLLKKIDDSHKDTQGFLSTARISLEKLAEEIEKDVAAIYMLQVQAIEEKRERYIASRESLNVAKTVGNTSEDKTESLQDLHSEELDAMDKELEEAELTLDLWFAFTSAIKAQAAATRLVNIPDPMAIREELVFSGPTKTTVQ